MSQALTRNWVLAASIWHTPLGRSNSLHRELAADLRAHKPGVIADLLAEYGAAIGGVAYLVVRDASDAEEIVMDTLEIAWRQAHKLRDDGALRTWLLRIATRQALSRRRRQRPTKPLEEAAWQSAPAWSEPSVDRLIVAEALSTLPERMRATVALHHYAGLTVPQTAQAMGTSENTVKSQLREGMARLRQGLNAPQPAVAARRNDSARRA